MQILLDIIVEPMASEGHARTFADLLGGLVHTAVPVTIEKYPKFDQAFRLSFTLDLSEAEYPFHRTMEISARVCSPWLTQYFDDEGRLEMIFNRDKLASYSDPRLEVIRWAHLQLVP